MRERERKGGKKSFLNKIQPNTRIRGVLGNHERQSKKERQRKTERDGSLMGAYSVIRKRLRPSWNKYNLLNLATKRLPPRREKTLYQQKWEGKQETRAYHGDHLTERQFQNLFESNLQGVAKQRNEKDAATPLQSQTFAPLERRLDTAVFRAMFASSVRQARQLIIHGEVDVNGTMMRHASYRLQPGDLFSVNPESVLVAVGRTKPPPNDIPATNSKSLDDSEIASNREASISMGDTQSGDNNDAGIRSKNREIPPEVSAQATGTVSSTEERKNEVSKEPLEQENSVNESEDLRAGELQTVSEQNEDTEALASKSDEDESADAEVTNKENTSYLGRENESRSFWTPWEPRPFMSPFAFYPAYLEVSPQTCSAIYIRDPVARPGLSEVPSPLPLNMHALAYSFYVRNRK